MGIQVENLVKTFRRPRHREGILGALSDLVYREYDEKKAVDNISFKIEPGEVVGYLGPNGAGKSTTIKMLAGILTPTSGSIRVGGLIPHTQRIENTKRIGVLFGQRSQLWWEIPVSESFQLLKYMYKISEADFRKRLGVFEELISLSDIYHLPVRILSLGQRMRAEMCAALLHQPDVLYLDEPTIGLDAVVKENIRNFIKQTNQETGTTVVLTTHDMPDIEKLCSRVIVIDRGRVMFDGNLEMLKHRFGSQNKLIVEVEDGLPDPQRLLLNGADEVIQEGRSSIITYDRNRRNSAGFLSDLAQLHKIIDFSVNEPDIEEIIRRMYKSLNQSDVESRN
ncbi:ABC transporter ATP-binding protein [Cohnella silvisoli]|uniref:ATP-binding cassette domain-containing protein n=1 Tax=Cohnella silvisoli TaxID=2873699 RepID=A0ABV1KLV1_9BACL|nr:ATP-binding cassette domain-containing protein [Cohnella silvisoli]